MAVRVFGTPADQEFNWLELVHDSVSWVDAHGNQDDTCRVQLAAIGQPHLVSKVLIVQDDRRLVGTPVYGPYYNAGSAYNFRNQTQVWRGKTSTFFTPSLVSQRADALIDQIPFGSHIRKMDDTAGLDGPLSVYEPFRSWGSFVREGADGSDEPLESDLAAKILEVMRQSSTLAQLRAQLMNWGLTAILRPTFVDTSTDFGGGELRFSYDIQLYPLHPVQPAGGRVLPVLPRQQVNAATAFNPVNGRPAAVSERLLADPGASGLDLSRWMSWMYPRFEVQDPYWAVGVTPGASDYAPRRQRTFTPRFDISEGAGLTVGSSTNSPTVFLSNQGGVDDYAKLDEENRRWIAENNYARYSIGRVIEPLWTEMDAGRVTVVPGQLIRAPVWHSNLGWPGDTHPLVLVRQVDHEETEGVYTQTINGTIHQRFFTAEATTSTQ